MIKTLWYWYSDRQVDKWNRTEDLVVNPHTYGHLIFDKGAKTIQWKKDDIFNKCCSSNLRSACRRKQIHPYLLSCTKRKSTCIKDLHIKPDTLNLIDVKVGKGLKHIGKGENFLNRFRHFNIFVSRVSHLLLTSVLFFLHVTLWTRKCSFIIF